MEEPVVVVWTSTGLVQGLWSRSSDGHAYLSYLGVPYAEPPVGELRFEAARPKRPWRGIWRAEKYGPPCVQFNTFQRNIIGHEDCLYLNIYTKATQCKQLHPGDKFPVIVYIHGGGFCTESGDDFFLGPQRAMNEQRIVLVTINYRLGAFGFMSTSDGVLEPNLGLKDQVVALKWIKANIGAFGGDRDNITLMGESAGAVSIHYHMLSPMSAGLFHKAILQSGSALGSWCLEDHPNDITYALTRKLGITSGNTETMKIELKKVDAKDIVKATEQVRLKLASFSFVPCVERVSPNLNSSQRFLTEDPLTLMIQGQIMDIPVIMGHNKNELALLAGLALSQPKVFSYLQKTTAMHTLLQLYFFKASWDLVRRAREHYNWLQPSSNKGEELQLDPVLAAKALGDEKIVFPNWKTKDFLLRQNKSKLFYYIYSHRGTASNTELMGYKGPRDLGVSHMDEVLLQFRCKLIPGDPVPGSTDDKVSRQLWKMWSNFARCSVPSAIWQPSSLEEDAYLDINDQPKLKFGTKSKDTSFWDEIHKHRVAHLSQSKSKL